MSHLPFLLNLDAGNDGAVRLMDELAHGPHGARNIDLAAELALHDRIFAILDTEETRDVYSELFNELRTSFFYCEFGLK